MTGSTDKVEDSITPELGIVELYSELLPSSVHELTIVNSTVPESTTSATLAIPLDYGPEVTVFHLLLLDQCTHLHYQTLNPWIYG